MWVILEGGGSLLFNRPHLFCSLLLCETHGIWEKCENIFFFAWVFSLGNALRTRCSWNAPRCSWNKHFWNTLVQGHYPTHNLGCLIDNLLSTCVYFQYLQQQVFVSLFFHGKTGYTFLQDSGRTSYEPFVPWLSKTMVGVLRTCL